MVVVKLKVHLCQVVDAIVRFALVPRAHAGAEASAAKLEHVVRVREDVGVALAGLALEVRGGDFIVVGLALLRSIAAHKELGIAGINGSIETAVLVGHEDVKCS